MANSDKPIIVDGIKVNVTAEDFDDLDVFEAFEAGSFVTGFKMLFGEDKYRECKEKLKDSETGRTSVTALSNWFEKVAERVGAKN